MRDIPPDAATGSDEQIQTSRTARGWRGQNTEREGNGWVVTR